MDQKAAKKPGLGPAERSQSQPLSTPLVLLLNFCLLGGSSLSMLSSSRSFGHRELTEKRLGLLVLPNLSMRLVQHDSCGDCEHSGKFRLALGTL